VERYRKDARKKRISVRPERDGLKQKEATKREKRD
jgi:hypothetical protein